jgi:hypothetical protein
MAELLRVWEGGRPEKDLLESRDGKGIVAGPGGKLRRSSLQLRKAVPVGCRRLPDVLLGQGTRTASCVFVLGSQPLSALEPGPDDQTRKKKLSPSLISFRLFGS